MEATLISEEGQFAKTIEPGLKRLEGEHAQLKEKTIPTATVFKFYDIYGLPTDLPADTARERG
ncbi:hypothetical protein CEJ73_19920, partial [Acinetobacter baumannii]